MTRKELEKYFSDPMYYSMRKYIKRVMKERPDIADADDIEFAANIMEQCAGDGVQLSVDDALRLTKNRDPIPTREEFNKKLESLGLASANEMVRFIKEMDQELAESKSETISMTTVARAAEMTKLGKKLSDGNRDIVLMGIPADLSWEFAQLKLAFLTDDLSDEEQKTIYDLRLLSDDVNFQVKHGIGYGMFMIDVK